MSETPIDPREHYVYALLREDGVTPFYVGMGRGDRWLDHEQGNTRSKGSIYKLRVIAKMRAAGISPVPKKKIAVGLTRQEAVDLEVRLIAEIGRHPHGPLTNMTAGGDGMVDLSSEAYGRQLRAARNKSVEHRERLRQSALRAWSDPAVATRQRAASAAAVQRPEIRAKIVANHPSKTRSPAERDAWRKTLQAAWDDPAKREARLARLKATWTPEKIAARTAKIKATWEKKKQSQNTLPPREKLSQGA